MIILAASSKLKTSISENSKHPQLVREFPHLLTLLGRRHTHSHECNAETLAHNRSKCAPKILRNSRKHFLPLLPRLHLAVALAVAPPAAPAPPQRPRASPLPCSRGVCRSDRGGPIAGETKFHPEVGQWGGPPTAGYNIQMSWDLRMYPTVAAPPSIGRGGTFKRRMLSSLFYKAGEFIKEAWEREGTVKDPHVP